MKLEREQMRKRDAIGKSEIDKTKWTQTAQKSRYSLAVAHASGKWAARTRALGVAFRTPYAIRGSTRQLIYDLQTKQQQEDGPPPFSISWPVFSVFFSSCVKCIYSLLFSSSRGFLLLSGDTFDFPNRRKRPPFILDGSLIYFL